MVRAGGCAARQVPQGLNVEFLGVARTLIVVSGASGALYTQLQIAVVWVIHNLKSLPELK